MPFGTIHVNAPLTNILEAYIQNDMDFVSTKAFPRVPVEKDTDFYYKFDPEAFLRDEAQLRGDNEESAGSDFKFSTEPYMCRVWAFHHDLGEQTLRRADNILNLQSVASRSVGRKMLIRQEVEWVNSYFQPDVWGTTVTGASDFDYWDDPTSDPEADIELGKEATLLRTGFEANTLIVSHSVWRHLRRHPLIKQHMQYHSRQIPTTEMMAEFFELDRILVSKSISATNRQGAGIPLTTAFTHGKHALLCYTAGTPAIMEPSAGYTFEWTGISDGLDMTRAATNFYIPETRTERIEGQIAFDMKLAGASLGYFFENVIS